MTKTQDDRILVSGQTRHQIGSAMEFKEASSAMVKGLAQPVQIYAPVFGASGEHLTIVAKPASADADGTTGEGRFSSVDEQAGVQRR